eukprot:6826021-Alexandrium_andersonii.AAC.1
MPCRAGAQHNLTAMRAIEALWYYIRRNFLALRWRCARGVHRAPAPVSYTHLTLPTICSV